MSVRILAGEKLTARHFFVLFPNILRLHRNMEGALP